MDIKEIAERVSKRIYVEDGLLLSKFISEKFAESLIAELAKQNEPVAIVGELSPATRAEALNKGIPIGAYLFTFPPTAEQIANETAEAIALMFDSRDDGNGFYDPNEPAEIVRSGAWKEFKK